ncbi:CPK2 [Symbiodinium natans]|uniref:CPK2 protein n=1 Tax=Symbiodinium natans TaxID=878477 RepID=A0A812V1P1_9DINO|nr:CPK2 [Symbiodinium natans]
MLCCGYPAFFAENEEELFERILGNLSSALDPVLSVSVAGGHVLWGSYAFLPEDWKQVSDQAKDLIRALMTRNPSRRCTAEQALNNHWINEHSSTGDHALNAETVDNLRSYCRANVIKKLALQVIAMHIGEDSIERQRNQFTSLDFNNNGVISLVEMSVGLEEAPSEVQGIFAGIDFNGSGYIEYTEFLAAALDKRQYLEDKMLAYAFQFFDRDGEGVTWEVFSHPVPGKSEAGTSWS